MYGGMVGWGGGVINNGRKRQAETTRTDGGQGRSRKWGGGECQIAIHVIVPEKSIYFPFRYFLFCEKLAVRKTKVCPSLEIGNKTLHRTFKVVALGG